MKPAVNACLLVSFFLIFSPVLSQDFASARSKSAGDEQMSVAKADKSRRSRAILAGGAILEGEAGVHFETSATFKPGNLGFGAFMNFTRIPKADFSNWTLVGLQIKAGPELKSVNPYFNFNFGIINMLFENDDVSMRYATLGLGGGIEKKLNDKRSLLFDLRWKRISDYKAERAAKSGGVLSVGLKF